MAVLHFFLVNSTLIYILFSLVVNRICHSKNGGLLKITPTFPLFRGFLVLSPFFLRPYCLWLGGRGGVCLISCWAPIIKSIKLKPFFLFKLKFKIRILQINQEKTYLFSKVSKCLNYNLVSGV